MANTGFKGIDVRQTANQLIFDGFLQDSSGALVTSGTTTVKLYEVQSDATIKSYDFNDNTFKTTALTTPTLALTHRTGNNATTNTGYWSAALSTLTGFTTGGIYLALVNNSSASPTDQLRKFQFGSAEGDILSEIRTGTLQAATSASVTLDANASSVTDFYRDSVIVITGGTGVGQARVINQYNGSTKIAVIFRAFYTTPDNTSKFSIIPLDAPAVGSSGGQVFVGNPTTTIRSSTCQNGGTSNTAVLDAAASSTNNIYVGNLLQIAAGSGAGQSRTIVAYNGTTKVATVDRNWITIPDNTSPFLILASLVPTNFSDQGVAQAGAATTITLASTASSTNSIYVGSIINILSGTGSGQTKEITAYVGATKVVTVDSAWSVNPDSTSAYAVIPTSSGTGSAPPSITATDILYTPLTETYAADGSTFTVAQALYEICQLLEERNLSGTTMTVKKRDGSSTAMTFTLNSAATPTTQTRAS